MPHLSFLKAVRMDLAPAPLTLPQAMPIGLQPRLVKLLMALVISIILVHPPAFVNLMGLGLQLLVVLLALV